MKAKLSRWDEETGRYVQIATIDINAWRSATRVARSSTLCR